MKKTINDGGPAFARPIGSSTSGIDCNSAQQGLTKRDYFAAMAIMGTVWDGGIHNEEIARRAYIIADSMIAERENVIGGE